MHIKILFAFMGNISVDGGMEHSCCNLANAMVDKGYEVMIAQGYWEIKNPFFKLNENIQIKSFFKESGVNRPASFDVGRCVPRWQKLVREVLRPISVGKMRSWNQYCRLKLLRPGITKIINDFRPNVIIAFSPDVAYYFMTCNSRVPVITRFSVRPSQILANASNEEKWAVEHSAAVQALLTIAKEEILSYCPRAQVVCIPNPVPEMKSNLMAGKKDKYKIVNVARLQKSQKRQQILVQSFQRIAGEFPQWNLELWGNNKAEPEFTRDLKDYIAKEKLENRVFIKGESHHVDRILSDADIFGFPSAYEGFPNALTEAMSAGVVPVICNDCNEAVALVQDEENGLISDATVDEYANKLVKVMSDEALRKRLGLNARAAMIKFKPETVWSKWDTLIHEVIKEEM